MNKTQLEQMGACAVNAAKSLQTATAQQKNIFFEEAIKLIQKNTNEILDANLQDINDAHSKNKDDAFIDRLRLDNARIDGICDALNEIQTFPDPVGKTLALGQRLGLAPCTSKRRVPKSAPRPLRRARMRL